MKNKLGRKIMTTFFGLRAKTYSDITDNANENKKAKCTKECIIK